MILALLAAVTVTFSPAKPTVGDPITIVFDEPVMLDFSHEYEQVNRYENVVIVRTFTPQPIVLSGTTGNTRFRNLQIPVSSVLKDGDDLRPAPLAPPRPMRWSWWWVAIAVAVLVAIALAFWWWIRSKKRAPVVVVAEATPEERFRSAVLALRANPSGSLRWAALADETRKYLAATRAQFGSDLTTTELVPRLDERERVVEEILRQGDLEKFSRRGAKLREFNELADRVLELTS